MSSFAKTLLTVLSVLGILAWGAGVFVGAHFAYDCSWPVSVSMGLGSMLLMGFFFFLSCFYARPKAGSEFGSGAMTKKWVFISLYLAVSIASAYYMIHAVACFTTFKTEIQEKANDEFTALKGMINEAASGQGSYKKYVNRQLAQYRDANPYFSDAAALDQEVADLSDLYLVKSQYPSLRGEIVSFGERAEYSIKHWDVFSVSSYLHQLDTKKGEWDTALVKCSQKGLEREPSNLHNAYEAIGPTYNDLATPLLNPSISNIDMASSMTMAVLQVLILMSWLAVGIARDKRATGLQSNDGTVGVWGQNKNQNNF